MTTTDAYAKGKLLKCIRGAGAQLVAGQEYESVGTVGNFVCLKGREGRWKQDCFIPAEAKGEECAACGGVPLAGCDLRHISSPHGTEAFDPPLRQCGACFRLPIATQHERILARRSAQPPAAEAPHPAPAKVDRPKPPVVVSDAEVAALMEQRQDQHAARLRNIAALAKELAAPIAGPRFPPDGRSDRVFGGRRW